MSDFWVDIYTASGQRTNLNTTAISNVRISERINQIGEMSFTLPAYIATQLGSTKGLKYRVNHSTQGYLGEYTQNDISVDANQKLATVTAHDSLNRLSNTIVGLARSFSGSTFDSVINSLMWDVGWIIEYEAGFDSSQLVTLDFRGESHLRALDALRQYVRGFFRRGSDNSIVFGAFKASTPVTTLRQATTDNMTGLPLIVSLRQERKGTSVANHVIPLGAGLGVTQLDLRYSTRGYPHIIGVESLGGQPAYYIEDSASVATHGRIARVLNFSQIRPITNSAADLANAANALYDMATAYLQRYKGEQDIYSVRVFNFPMSIHPGDLVKLQYNGVVELENSRVGWLSVDQNFFITQINRSFDGNGEPVADLTISASGEDIVGITEVVSNILEDTSRFKLRVQPSMSLYTKASQTMPIDSSRTYEFTFYIGGEVLALNAMTLEFTLGPLRTYAANSTDGGGVAHTHAITVKGSTLNTTYPLYMDSANNFVAPARGVDANGATQQTDITHTHPLTFGVADDSLNPTGVTISVNGTTVTSGITKQSGAGSTTGAAATGPGVFTVDILSLLTSSDFRNRTHTITFTCGSNRGLVFAQLLGRVTIQPIAA